MLPELPEKFADGELNRVAILTRIARAITDGTDLVRIFQIALQKIRHYCFCDTIQILYNNADSQSFYIPPALNLDVFSPTPEISIFHQQTMLGKIATTLAPINCPDLSLETVLQAGDAKLFPGKQGAFLALPIFSQNSLHALLLMVNAQPHAFQESDQDLVEDICVLLAVAIDQAILQRQAKRDSQNAQHWQRIYHFLMEKIDAPIALINPEDDLIYQVNPAFTALTQFSAEELHGMKLSRLHALDLFGSNLKSITPDTQITLKDVPLGTQNGVQKISQLCLFNLSEPAQKQWLAIYKPMRTELRSGFHHLPPLTEFVALFASVVKTPVLPGDLPPLTRWLQRLGTVLGLKYLTLYRVHHALTPELVFASKFPVPSQTSYQQPYVLALNAGPIAALSARSEPYFVADLQNDTELHSWYSISEKLGYAAIAAFPQSINPHTRVLLTFFYEQPQPFDDETRALLNLLAGWTWQLMHTESLEQQAQKLPNQMAALNQLTQTITAAREIEEVIRLAILELCKVLNFDYVTINLFDESGEHFQVFTILSRTLSNTVKIGQWLPFEETDFGWLRLGENLNGVHKKQYARELMTLEAQFSAKINLLLLVRNKYLGTFTMASLTPSQFSAEPQQFMQQLVVPLAVAIENARLFESAQRNLTEFSALAEISKTISTSLEIDQIFDQIARATVMALGAKLCLIRRMDARSGFKVAIPEIKGLFGADGLTPHIERAMRELTPLFFEDISQVLATGATPQTVNVPTAVLLMPVVADGRAMAMIFLFWENHRRLSAREQQILAIIANQAANALHNARLYQETVQKSQQLQVVNEELENFVYTVSHDLKAPVVSIQGFASILLQEFAPNLPADARHYLERIEGNANQMEKLIQDLLELSRIGRVVNPFEMVAVAQIIREAQGELIYQIQEKKIQLEIQPELPHVFVDRRRLMQVFVNLISNAVKYIGAPAQPRIGIGCKELAEAYQFFVKDNGIGIEKQYHEKIFGLFQILNPDQDPNTQGTGVGLAIVKRIVENHGGRIWVDSEPGQGATFYFTIPKPLAINQEP